MQQTTKKIVADVALFALSQVVFFVAVRYVLTSIDPNKSNSKETKSKSEKVLSRLGVKDVKLNEHETAIAAEVIHPDDISVKFADIGGLDPIIEQLRETVIYPLTSPAIFESAAGLLGAPKGVLLYGPPGCGKTMLAKALAKESGATFINVPISTLSSKWYGESNKLVAALFTLARKLQPSIIFIDEIDSFMRERRSSDHEISGTIKAEFMSSWDGLLTGTDVRIMVLGATNRPNDIDQAILRRMPKRFPIRLPDLTQRRNILKLLLKDIKCDSSFDIDILARQTEGMSGSDLKEFCRNAMMGPVRDHMRSEKSSVVASEKSKNAKLRPLRMVDFSTGPVLTNNSTSSTDPDTLD